LAVRRSLDEWDIRTEPDWPVAQVTHVSPVPGHIASSMTSGADRGLPGTPIGSGNASAHAKSYRSRSAGRSERSQAPLGGRYLKAAAKGIGA
jgi:hypothetical protein